jgi:hypothetical protein
MKAGGKLLQQERENEQRRLETRELEQKKRQIQTQTASGGAYPDDSGFNLFGGPLRSSDPDLFDIVSTAIRFFTK